jgi:hypothetical protein
MCGPSSSASELLLLLISVGAAWSFVPQLRRPHRGGGANPLSPVIGEAGHYGLTLGHALVLFVVL